MDTVNIQIALDPINDGASFIPKETEVKNEGALIIATNGDHKIINEIDPNAFVSQSAVIGVYGEGFDHFKMRTKKPKVVTEAKV